MKYNPPVPKFRKKYVRGKSKPSHLTKADLEMLREEKEDRALKSSSSSYKDNIDSV